MNRLLLTMVAACVIASSAAAAFAGLTLADSREDPWSAQTQKAVDCYKLFDDYMDAADDSQAEDRVSDEMDERGCW